MGWSKLAARAVPGDVWAGLFVGLVTLDVVQRVDRVPGPNDKVVASSADIAAGGPATNAAVAFAALGGKSTLLTAVGVGPIQSVVSDDLSRHAVTVVDAATAGHPGPAISAVSVLAATGERSVVSRNAEQAYASVPTDLPDLVGAADVLLVDGHLAGLARAAVAAAGAARIPVVYDGGSWKPAFADVLSSIDAAVCSGDFTVPSCASAEESALALLTMGIPFAAFTDGPRPIRWWTEHDAGTVEAATVTARDTLGAGDAFHGTFAFAIAAGLDQVRALRLAADVAAVRVEHVGPRAWLSDPRLQSLAAQVAR
jgi:sugar/nucleoside kinase (ribokinase family)